MDLKAKCAPVDESKEVQCDAPATIGTEDEPTDVEAETIIHDSEYWRSCKCQLMKLLSAPLAETKC